MRNHDEKVRDMARSVLPSAMADGQVLRRRIHHIERGRVNAALRRAALVHDSDDVASDLAHTERHALRDFVDSRRYRDRVNSLVRWARCIVDGNPELRDAPLEERLDHFRRLLPDDLIGQHALGHLESALDPASRAWRRRPTVDRGPEVLAALDAILAAGAHGELNRLLRACTDEVLVAEPPWVQRQPVTERLHGAHDRDRFAAAVRHRPAACDVVIEHGRRCR